MFTMSSKFKPSDLNDIENRSLVLYNFILDTFDVSLNTYPGDDVYPGDDLYPSDFDELVFKLDWDETDPPFLDEIDRIKNNILTIGSLINIPSEDIGLVTGIRFFNYNEANKLYLAIDYIYDYVSKLSFRYSGESYSGDTIWL